MKRTFPCITFIEWSSLPPSCSHSLFIHIFHFDFGCTYIWAYDRCNYTEQWTANKRVKATSIETTVETELVIGLNFKLLYLLPTWNVKRFGLAFRKLTIIFNWNSPYLYCTKSIFITYCMDVWNCFKTAISTSLRFFVQYRYHFIASSKIMSEIQKK